MDVSKEECRKVFWGIAVLTAIFFVICILVGQFDLPMFLGGLLGAVVGGLNFVLLCLSVEGLLEKDAHRARSSAAFGYFFRLLFTAVVIIFGYTADFINVVGVVIPLFFPKFALIASYLCRKGGEK